MLFQNIHSGRSSAAFNRPCTLRNQLNVEISAVSLTDHQARKGKLIPWNKSGPWRTNFRKPGYSSVSSAVWSSSISRSIGTKYERRVLASTSETIASEENEDVKHEDTIIPENGNAAENRESSLDPPPSPQTKPMRKRAQKDGKRSGTTTQMSVKNREKRNKAPKTRAPSKIQMYEVSSRMGSHGEKQRVVQEIGKAADSQEGLLMVMQPLPRVLVIHTGGTLGMDPEASYNNLEDRDAVLKEGTGGEYSKGLKPASILADLKEHVPELMNFANLDVKVAFNRDSCRVGPKDWINLAQMIHKNRQKYHAFLIVHGTDTMAYTASALSLMLSGFEKPVILTGSQLPLLLPRSDARQNLIDSITCATAGTAHPYVQLHEVAVCFGGKLMRGNRCQKTNSCSYQAFSSPSYPDLAQLGVEVDWNQSALLPRPRSYQPRFNLNNRVIRIPIVPGCDPRVAYGDLYKRGVRGAVLEAFGLGNLPDTDEHGWIPWLRQQREQGLMVSLTSQCTVGDIHPELYRSGHLALEMGVEAGPQMTAECAVAKMMLCLAYPDLTLSHPLAGEL